jgi:hypothetical protein
VLLMGKRTIDTREKWTGQGGLAAHWREIINIAQAKCKLDLSKNRVRNQRGQCLNSSSSIYYRFVIKSSFPKCKTGMSWRLQCDETWQILKWWTFWWCSKKCWFRTCSFPLFV